MSSTLELAQGAKFFTKLDLRNAYNLVRIREGDEWKTVFNIPSGHYEYLLMPFGLSNSPAVFQALVNTTLTDVLNLFIFVYLDDILDFSKIIPEHILLVRQVLRRLLQSQLYVEVKNCEFHVSQVSFMGHIISTVAIQMDPVKVEEIADWPCPTSLRADVDVRADASTHPGLLTLNAVSPACQRSNDYRLHCSIYCCSLDPMITWLHS
jgi:hypothetical protein